MSNVVLKKADGTSETFEGVSTICAKDTSGEFANKFVSLADVKGTVVSNDIAWSNIYFNVWADSESVITVLSSLPTTTIYGTTTGYLLSAYKNTLGDYYVLFLNGTSNTTLNLIYSDSSLSTIQTLFEVEIPSGEFSHSCDSMSVKGLSHSLAILQSFYTPLETFNGNSVGMENDSIKDIISATPFVYDSKCELEAVHPYIDGDILTVSVGQNVSSYLVRIDDDTQVSVPYSDMLNGYDLKSTGISGIGNHVVSVVAVSDRDYFVANETIYSDTWTISTVRRIIYHLEHCTSDASNPTEITTSYFELKFIADEGFSFGDGEALGDFQLTCIGGSPGYLVYTHDSFPSEPSNSIRVTAYNMENVEELHIMVAAKLEYRDCIAFLGDDGDFTLTARKQWDGMVEYSTDHSSWQTWDGTEISSANQKLYLRGNGNTTFFSTTTARYCIVPSAKAGCYGNIMTLLNYENPTLIIPSENCFERLFASAAYLTAAPELPATTLSARCYTQMFAGSGIKKPPELPSIEALPDYCYLAMFQQCQNIKLSETQTGNYLWRYKVPSEYVSSPTSGTDSVTRMFLDTGGTFTDDPTLGKSYYMDIG